MGELALAVIDLTGRSKMLQWMLGIVVVVMMAGFGLVITTLVTGLNRVDASIRALSAVN